MKWLPGNYFTTLQGEYIVKEKKIDVGVIVGRFQVHELHNAHKELINNVRDLSQRVIIFIGLSPLRNTIRNPLGFRERRRMIQESYPDIEVYYIDDNRSDVVWSHELDQQIEKWTSPSEKVVLFGSRDSFIPHYFGKYPTQELDATTIISGSEIRRRIASNYAVSKDYRAGVIAATFNRYPTVYTTVDIAVYDEKGRILLARKPKESKLRLIGGFASPESTSFEIDARREVQEESGVEISDPVYVTSMIIDDWRYRNETDKIKTILFAAQYVFGRPQGGDDVESVEWVDIASLTPEHIMPEHVPLVTEFKSWYSHKNLKIN